MVHALREARRVLKPGGILIDLRPAIMHSRVGILRAGRFRELGKTRETFEGSRAANRAMSRALAQRLFRRLPLARFHCDVVFSSSAALREWLADYTDQAGLPAHEKLIRRALAASRTERGAGKIAYRIALEMRVLRRDTQR
jgi:ubiquinone/menaquinone biosynthesis C-methylase UbiE